MKRRAPNIDQGELFSALERTAPVTDADLDLGPELLGALNTVFREVRKEGMSRERIVDAMNKLLPDLERPLTLRQLNAWTARSKEYHELPARYLAAFCAATGSDLPLRVVAKALGYDLVDAREQAAKRLGETHVEIGRLRRELKQLEGALS